MTKSIFIRGSGSNGIRSSLTLLAFIFSSVPTSLGQGNCDNPIFRFDFSGQDKNSFISCGKIFNTTIWVVVDDTCWLWTEDIPLSEAYCSESGNVTDVNIRMDMMGQTAPATDWVRPVIKCDGITMVDDTIYGGESGWPPIGSSVRLQTYSVPCAYPSILKIYVQIASSDPQNGFKVFSGDACGASCYVPIPLAIELSPLRALLAGNQAHFDLEIYDMGGNQPEVVLECSEDGRSFMEITSTTHVNGETYHLVYNYPDNRYPYYRVKVALDNGEVSYSNVVYLCSEDLRNAIVVSPNPVHAGETISITGVEDIASIFLYNVQGELVVDCKMDLQATESEPLLHLPRSLAKGLYVLEVRAVGNTLWRSSLVVQ